MFFRTGGDADEGIITPLDENDAEELHEADLDDMND
jgi:hypothetical protein